MVLSTKRTFKKRQDNSLIHMIDWHPTILSLAKAPKAENVDGEDFSAILENKEQGCAFCDFRKTRFWNNFQNIEISNGTYRD